jgi:hypothetical protein
LEDHSLGTSGQRGAEEFGDQAFAIYIDTDGPRSALVEEVQQRWKRRILDDDDVSEVNQRRRNLVDPVHGAIHHGELVGLVGPVEEENIGQVGYHVIIEITA